MSTGGWLILLFFVGAIVVIIFKWLITDDESGSEIPPKPPTPEPKQIPVQKEQQNYVTIYEFNSVKNVKICRYCDGENPMDAHQCCICGEEIDA